jgi:hypothetical protein
VAVSTALLRNIFPYALILGPKLFIVFFYPDRTDFGFPVAIQVWIPGSAGPCLLLLMALG